MTGPTSSNGSAVAAAARIAKSEHWSSRTAFVFAAIGSAIGLGNVWRFPRVCAENGGFAFLIAFVVALFTAGIPILILELAMGERTQRATPGALRRARPAFEWVGWCIVGVGFLITTYYAIVMSWCCSYMLFSFGQPWETDPSGFFFNEFLAISDPAALPGGWGKLSWPILIGSAVSWGAVILCIWKGVETVSKVVYATVTIPWILLLLFVIRGFALPGSGEGLAYYLFPDGDWTRFLLSFKTWREAYTQVFFSLSIGFGIMFAYGSFLDRETDIVKNAFIIGISDALTAFVAGLAVFASLGHIASLPADAGGKPIADWMGSSLGIAFVAYPTLISKTPMGFVLGPMFFLMLFLLAVDSAFSLVEAGVKPLEDKFGWSHKRAMFTVCGLGFVLGIPFAFQSGLFWFDTVDHFMNHLGLAVACLAECVAFGYFYGARRIRRELLEHRENHLGRWWDVMILFVAPVVLVALVGAELWDRFQALSSGKGYEGYGVVVELLGGWLPLGLILVVAGALAFSRGHHTFRQDLTPDPAPPGPPPPSS